jgi:hypothetical protein
VPGHCSRRGRWELFLGLTAPRASRHKRRAPSPISYQRLHSRTPAPLDCTRRPKGSPASGCGSRAMLQRRLAAPPGPPPEPEAGSHRPPQRPNADKTGDQLRRQLTLAPLSRLWPAVGAAGAAGAPWPQPPKKRRGVVQGHSCTPSNHARSIYKNLKAGAALLTTRTRTCTEAVHTLPLPVRVYGLLQRFIDTDAFLHHHSTCPRPTDRPARPLPSVLRLRPPQQLPAVRVPHQRTL